MLVHEVITGKLAAADLARIVLHIQVQQSDLSSTSARGILSRPVINTILAAAFAAAFAAVVAASLVDPRWQQMPLGVFPVAILRLEGVLAVATSVAATVAAIVAIVAAVVARVVARAARVASSSRCRSAVLVVLA